MSACHADIINMKKIYKYNLNQNITRLYNVCLKLVLYTVLEKN